MSELVVNGEAVSVNFEPDLSVGDILSNHVDAIVPDGQIVCQVHADGQDQGLEELCWGKIGRLSIVTAHPVDLVIDGLGSSGEVMQEARQNMGRAAEDLKAGDQKGFANSFVQGIDGLLSVLRFIGLAVAHLGSQAEALVDYQSELEALISEVAAAQQAEDMVLMADLIAFELEPKLDAWDGVSQDMISSLRPARQRAAS